MSIFNRLPTEIKNFEEKFNKETHKILAVTEGGMSAGRAGHAKYWTVAVTILAYIDIESGELFEGRRRLEWLVNEEQRRSCEKIYDLHGQKTYELLVRESLAFSNEYTGETIAKGQRFMLVGVEERECYNSQLESILEEYQREVSIQPTGCEKLLLDKSLAIFSGNGIWNCYDCYINIESDGEGLETAGLALETYEELVNNSNLWDQKAREYAAKELTELANDWAEEDDSEITEAGFMKRIFISEVCASSGGQFDLFYNDDDMFGGHVIIVSGNINGKLDSADIAG